METLFYDLDLMGFDELLRPEEREARATARAFVREEVAPRMRDCEREARFPSELVPGLARLGVLGAQHLDTPPDGIPRLGPVAYGLCSAEVERLDSGLRSFGTVQGNLFVWPVLTYGSAAQIEEWVPAVVTGRATGAFALTEPTVGSDPGEMKAEATPVAGGYRLSGAKRWSTHAYAADVILVWARTPAGVRGFLVRKGAKGLQLRRIRDTFSFRTTVTSELSLDRCFVPEADVLPRAEGLVAALRCLNQARYGIAWGVTGAAEACYGETLAYLSRREQFGKPMTAFQLVQRKLTKMASAITLAKLLAWRLGRLKEEGTVRFEQISLAKRNNADMALTVARTCRDMLGANGITDDFRVGRHLCNLESVKTYEGAHDVHTLIVGKHLTGHEAW